MNFEAFLKNKKYTFTFSELEQYGIKSLSKNEIEHYTKEEYIFPLLKDFSLIIPPERKGFKQIPFIYHIEGFGEYLNNKDDYYVSSFTASAYHGSSHQTVFTDFLTLKKNTPVLNEPGIEYHPHNDFDGYRIENDSYRFKIQIRDTFPPKHEANIEPKTPAPVSKSRFYFKWANLAKNFPIYRTNRKNIWRKEFLEEGHGFNLSSPSLTAVDLIHDR